MGWGTTLITDIYFSRDTYTSLDEVQRKLRETNEIIESMESKLHDYALMTEPQKFFESEGNDYDFADLIHERLRDIILELEDCYILRYKLSLLLNAWTDCHDENDLANGISNEIWNHHTYIDGDFIKTVNDKDRKTTIGD